MLSRTNSYDRNVHNPVPPPQSSTRVEFYLTQTQRGTPWSAFGNVAEDIYVKILQVQISSSIGFESLSC